MQCPKCAAPMDLVGYQEIAVHRCTGCQGLWFDRLEQEHLRAIEGSESIDIGSAQVGKQYNDYDNIACPDCCVPMIKMVDALQPHIWYEACTVCFGVFFDAGEFRDYKERTVLDFFRDIFTKERA